MHRINAENFTLKVTPAELLPIDAAAQSELVANLVRIRLTFSNRK